jgi:hypothetical protein
MCRTGLARTLPCDFTGYDGAARNGLCGFLLGRVAGIHIPLWPLQDADDPAAATRHVPIDHGSYRVSPNQVDQRAAIRTD